MQSSVQVAASSAAPKITSAQDILWEENSKERNYLTGAQNPNQDAAQVPEIKNILEIKNSSRLPP